MEHVLDCPCGVRIVASDPDELVLRAREHLGLTHPGRDYTADEILFLASTRRTPEATAPEDPER